jgi:hypothetical protein
MVKNTRKLMFSLMLAISVALGGALPALAAVNQTSGTSQGNSNVQIGGNCIKSNRKQTNNQSNTVIVNQNANIKCHDGGYHPITHHPGRTGYADGYRDGYKTGYQDRFKAGRQDCKKHFYSRRGGPSYTNEYNRGYSDGYSKGFDAGFDYGCKHH